MGTYDNSQNRDYNPNALQTKTELTAGFEGNNHYFTAKFPASDHPYACQKASCAVEVKEYADAMPSMAGKPELENSTAFEDHVLLVINACYPSGNAMDGFQKRSIKLLPSTTKVNGNNYSTIAALKTAVLGLINS